MAVVYGRAVWGAVDAIWGGADGTGTAPTKLSQPKRNAYSIRFYDRDDVLQGVISSNAASILISCKFDLTPQGCGSFDIQLAQRPSFPIPLGTRVDIHLMNDTAAWYSGECQQIPDESQTDYKQVFRGTGYANRLKKLMITASYENKSPSVIVADLMAKQIQKRCPIRYDSNLIQLTKFKSGKLSWLRQKADKVIEALAGLAGGFEYGVDEQRKLFFRKPSTRIGPEDCFWVSKHLTSWELSPESRDLVNIYNLKLSKVRTDLVNSSPFFGTNWLINPVRDEQSIMDYGEFEDELSIPGVFDGIDAVRYGYSKLAENALPKRQGQASGVIFRGEKVEGSGKIRVFSRTGVKIELPKKKVSYSIASSLISMDIEVGIPKKTAYEFLSELASKQASESLGRQQSQQQLA